MIAVPKSLKSTILTVSKLDSMVACSVTIGGKKLLLAYIYNAPTGIVILLLNRFMAGSLSRCQT